MSNLFSFEDFSICSRLNNVNYGAWYVYKPVLVLLLLLAGVTADLDPPRIWTPGPNPLADMDPLSQI